MLRRDILKYCAGFIPFVGFFNKTKKNTESYNNIVTHIHLYTDDLIDNKKIEFTSYHGSKWSLIIKNREIYLQHLNHMNKVCFYRYTGIDNLTIDIDNIRKLNKNKKHDIIVIHLHDDKTNKNKSVSITSSDII